MGRTWRRAVTTTMGVVLAVSVVGCLPTGAPPSTTSTTVPGPGVPTTTPGPAPRVYLPAIPLPPASSYVVDRAAIEQLGCERCDEVGATDPARFFYGTMPLGAVDRLVGADELDLRATLGELFASGYFGGIYLRGNLSGGAAADLSPFAPVLDAVGALSQSGLDALVTDLVGHAENGTDQEVRDAAGFWAAVLAAIAGYNRGYLEVLLQHPPAGVTVPPSALTCGSLFDCRSADLPLPALDTLSAQRDALVNPPSFEWFSVATIANGIGSAAVPAGRDVWNGILGTSSLDPASYRTVVDLSAGFLQVTQAALLANLAGPTNGDIELVRRGLETTAGLLTWAGSYFLGLASSLPNSALPTLTCS